MMVFRPRPGYVLMSRVIAVFAFLAVLIGLAVFPWPLAVVFVASAVATAVAAFGWEGVGVRIDDSRLVLQGHIRRRSAEFGAISQVVVPVRSAAVYVCLAKGRDLVFEYGPRFVLKGDAQRAQLEGAGLLRRALEPWHVPVLDESGQHYRGRSQQPSAPPPGEPSGEAATTYHLPPREALVAGSIVLLLLAVRWVAVLI